MRDKSIFNMDTEVPVGDIIKKHRDTLLTVVDVNKAFLTELVGEGELEEAEMQRIWHESTTYEKNQRLLEWLSGSRRSAFVMFLKKLRENRQSYVANLLDGTPGELPLSPEIRQKIQKNFAVIQKKLDPDSGLIDHLLRNDVISSDESSRLYTFNKLRRELRSEEILYILLRGSDQGFDIFKEGLRKTFQNDIADIFDAGQIPDSASTSAQFKVLQQHEEILQRCTHINELVVEFLRAKKIIAESMYDRLNGMIPFYRNTAVYGWLQTQSTETYKKYLQVMNDTEQKHVANCLMNRDDIAGPHGPLSAELYDRLQQISPDLMMGMIATDLLVANLRSQRVSDDTDFAISETDLQEINVERQTPMKKNQCVINAILRRSNHSFDCFQKALIETEQKHMADFLTEGFILRTRISTTRPDRDESFSELINDARPYNQSPQHDGQSSPNRKLATESLNKVEKNLGLPLITAQPSSSIMFYIYCKTTDDVKQYVKLLKSGKLCVFIECFLNELLRIIEPDNEVPLQAVVTLDEESELIVKEIIGSEEFVESVPAEEINEHQSKDSDIGKDVQILRKELQRDLEETTGCMSDSLQKKEQIEIYKVNFLKQMEVSKEAVQKTCDELKGRIDQYSQMLLHDIVTFKDKCLDVYGQQTRKIESYMEVFKGFQEHTIRLLDRGSDRDISRTGAALTSRAEKIKQQFLHYTNENSDTGAEGGIVQFLPGFPGVPAAFKLIGTQDIVELCKSMLKERMHSDFGLIEKLVQSGALSAKEVENINKATTRGDKNNKILNFIVQNQKFKDLIDALTATNQTHLANYLKTNGAYEPGFLNDWPLTEPEVRLLDSRKDYIIENVDTKKLLDTLQEMEVINEGQKTAISSKSSEVEKNRALLEILRCGSLHDYGKMICCLIGSNQGHIAQLLQQARENLFRQRIILEELMEHDYGLLKKLHLSSTLTREEIKTIKAAKTQKERNSLILNFVNDKNKVKQLIDALNDTEQKHLANILSSNGVYKPEFGREWPLIDLQTITLDALKKPFFDQFETSQDLLAKLSSANIINKDQERLISSMSNSTEKVMTLLGILRRGSQNSYIKATEIALQPNQGPNQIQGGQQLRFQPTVTDIFQPFVSVPNIDQTEADILSRFGNLIEMRKQVNPSNFGV